MANVWEIGKSYPSPPPIVPALCDSRTETAEDYDSVITLT